MARTHWRWVLALLLAAAMSMVACMPGSSGAPDLPARPDSPPVDNGFESGNPAGTNGSGSSQNSTSGGGSGGALNAGTGAAAPAAPGDSAQRAIEEADIIKVDGNLLYALSRFGGLSVVDITDPDHMTILGRKRTEGMPFEMYVRGGRAYVMLNDFARWVTTSSSAYGEWVQSSEILALDLTNPASITELTHFDIPGSIADSRLIGDVLYLVTYESGYCWKCLQGPSTIVTSFNLAGSLIAQVDQLAYSAPNNTYASWQRSVSATNQRLYIAGPTWNWQPGATQASSIIQVVDITDPGGHLLKGADVPVAGQINSRWQMDEDSGVLRVVSQFGNGWFSPNGSLNPLVQTFAIASSSQITPLGSTELMLPTPESLQSVRFDGPRGYAITSQRRDPLFTIDLSNPAQPKQAGQVTMPGFVIYMEPRGDRLVGFGYDDTNAGNAHLAASLFDVSNLANPIMLKRVSFGNGWGTFAEDLDRIQKSVQVLDAAGLVLVPFASYGQWNGGSCTSPQSGIQLIDYTHDDLVLRGLAPQHGLPRRALLANGRLLAVSDRNVTSFDITSRDAPAKKDEIDLANPAYQLVELPNHIASLSNDWWTGEVELSLTPKAHADDAVVTGKLSLASLATPSAAYCSGPSGWTEWYSARLFANGNMVYLTVPVYTYDQAHPSARLVVAAIDSSDPARPVLAGKADVPLTVGNGWYGNGFLDGYNYYSYYGALSNALLASGKAVVQFGAKLAYLEVDNEVIQTPTGLGSFPSISYDVRVHRKLHVVDFADPQAPSVRAPVELPGSLGAAPLQLWNGMVLTSRWVGSGNDPSKVRFYVDRVDIRGDNPVLLVSLNTPGSLLLADEPSQRFVTVDYATKRAAATDWSSCMAVLGDRAQFDYGTHACVVVVRSFKLVDVSGRLVTLRQTFEPPAQNLDGIEIADDRVYVTRYPRYDYTSCGAGGTCMPTRIEDGGLWAIGGVRAGALSIVSRFDGDALWPLAAHGTRVALYTQGGLAIYDTTTPVASAVTEAHLRGWGYTSDVLLGDDHATFALGDWGLQTISY